MISLPKEKVLKYFGRFFLLLTGLAVLFGSLVLSGLKIMANDKKTDSLRSIPIEYIKEMDNGERISRIYKVPESNVGPGDIKYPIKKLRDRLWIELSQTAKDKSEVCLLIADKRMFEAVELNKKQKDENLFLKTLNASINSLKEAKEILLKEDNKKVEIVKINQQINQAGLAYEDIVKSLNYKNEKIDKIINDLETWNQKNIEKKRKNKGFFSKKWWILVAILFILVVIYIIKEIPNPTKLSSGEYPQSSRILDRKGRLLFEIYGEKRRNPIELKEVSDSLKKATLAIEDVNFYKHNGFDLRGILRGLYRSVFQKRLQGGSTLTQQLVKNALLTQERTISRKIKEAILTVATEILYNKDQILEMYFNQTPYGGTIWGVQSAARGFFNKDVKDLNLAESALIAGLPGSPTKYNPFSHPEAAKARQEMVLTRMNEVGFISKEEMEKAKAEKLNYYLDKTGILAPHFVFYVKEQLTEKYGLKKLTEGGLRITTSLDLDIQKLSETIVASEVAKLKKSNVTNGAALITEPKTGQILAMIGSVDYFSDEIDGKYNVATALRQPGSSIKPLNYAVGLELGKITAAAIVDDSPTCFEQINQKAYCPTNYGNSYHGLQTIRNSLANSLNIGAVKVLKLNGLETFVASASAMGLTTLKDPSNYGLSLTLGGGEVYMTDMATAYGIFANMGVRQNLTPILKVEDKDGKILEEFQETPGERILSRETSYIVQNILSDDGARSMVFGRGSLLNIKGHPEVAVKTGTTNDLRDNWTYGYTSDYVVGTWVGNNNNSKMTGVVSGTSGAAPIWNKIMTEILKDKTVKKPVMPTNIIGINVCNLTGGAIPEGGCDSHYEYFNKDFLPKKTTTRMNVLINKDTGKIVVDNEVAPNAEWQEHTVVTDLVGVKICLDCPLVGVGVGETGKKTPAIVN